MSLLLALESNIHRQQKEMDSLYREEAEKYVNTRTGFSASNIGYEALARVFRRPMLLAERPVRVLT